MSGIFVGETNNDQRRGVVVVVGVARNRGSWRQDICGCAVVPVDSDCRHGVITGIADRSKIQVVRGAFFNHDQAT